MTIEKLKDKLHNKIEIYVCEVEENTLIAQGMLKALGMMDEVLETAEESNLEKICEELAAENDDLRDQLAMRDRFKQDTVPVKLRINKVSKHISNIDLDELEQEPCDTVSRGVFEQVKWERDIAIEQLHELGYELGQKIEPCDDVVSRQAVLGCATLITSIPTEDWDIGDWVCLFRDRVSQLPSVRPQELTREEQTLLRKWRDNRGISMEDFEDAMDALQNTSGSCV